MIGRRTRLLAAVLLAAVFFVGCSGEQEESGKQETSSEGSTATTPETTVEETTGETTIEETTAETAAVETGEEASSLPQEGRSPEEVLALQYEYINRGDFEKAYSLFDEQSQQEISLGQYRAFFEANAPYSVTDYSFPSVQTQGDSTTVEAAFTVNSATGAQQLQRTQRLVRESGDWRVVMRPEQLAAFSATSSPASKVDTPPEPKAQEKSPSKARAAREAAASEVTLSISGTAGIPYRGSFGGAASSRSGRQDVEGTIGQGQNEYRLSDITGDVQVRSVSAFISKARPGVEGDLRVQILYQGEVVEENLATGTAGAAPVSWSPGLP